VNARQARYKLQVAQALLQTGMIRPVRPDRALRAVAALQRWGPTPAAAYIGAAARYPDATALVDDRGGLTFSELNRRTNALARGLAGAGLSEGDAVAIMCRNHRGFVEATAACSKLGVGVLYLNTSFAGPQITDVLAREDPAAVIYDEEFTELVREGAAGRLRFVASREGEGEARGEGEGEARGEGEAEATPDPHLEDLIEGGDDSELKAPAEPGRVVILTSGTTGTPKGAARRQPDSMEPAAALFSKIPLRARETTVIAAPMFHSWGFAHFSLALPLASTVVLRRRFDPEETLRAISQHRASALAVVPVMLQRILELGEETLGRYDTGSLRVIALSGSALPGELATRAMDVFGDVLYNLYGSTEVAWATIATPEDLRAAPGTAGRAPMGTVVKLLDEGGAEVRRGETGRIFVGNEMVFEGYTGGGNKEIIGGLMSTGDVGRLDSGGRLFVEGRDDEMIVSGGENVFPREVEDLLADHAEIEEAAVVGVSDKEFGQRLKAFVVPRDGAKLSEDAVQGYVKSNLARYKVPREVVFLQELPRNATGKVLKRELGSEGARGAPKTPLRRAK
jgi:acyl-CoA synthetase (AMP-forming)/AMP-acid ligase II